MSHSSLDVFGTCLAQVGEDATTKELLECVSFSLSRAVPDGLDEPSSKGFTRSIVVVFAAALVFFMQAGFAMLCAGAVRAKNVQNTMLKNLLDACGAAIAFFTVGYAFAFGGTDFPTDTDTGNNQTTFIGTSNFFLVNVDDYSFWLFQYAFSAASATIVAGTLAERCQMAAYLGYSALLTGWVYPIVAHAVWNVHGFLSAHAVEPLWGVGMVDFAGSGVVHVTGGVTALFATIILGPRRGRFHDQDGQRLIRPRIFPGHSFALQMLGTLILWFGWYGFNIGAALLLDVPSSDNIAALAAVNTTLSGGTAGIVALFFNLWYLDKRTGEAYFDLKFAMNGCLCGLVAITGGCGVVEPWAAVVIGFVAGLLYNIGSRGLMYLRLDDAVDAIPVHLCNGSWGLVAVGLFASPSRLLVIYGHSDHPGWFYSLRDGESDFRLLASQLVGLIFIVFWVMFNMLPFFVWLNYRGWFRSDPLEELVGLDLSYHGGLMLHEEVDPEYISAYRKGQHEAHSRTLRQRKRTSHVRLESVSEHSVAPNGGDSAHTSNGDSLTETVTIREPDSGWPRGNV
jgi:Amt family ammonium transporter